MVASTETLVRLNKLAGLALLSIIQPSNACPMQVNKRKSTQIFNELWLNAEEVTFGAL